MYRIFYNEIGQIVAYDNEIDMHGPAQAKFVFCDQMLDRNEFIYDDNLNDFRPMNESEKKILNAPIPMELLAARAIELQNTDWRQNQTEWAIYRQALRDLTAKGRDTFAMLRAWPLRPDGSDAIPHWSEYK